jgi:hypothetical protein
LTGRLEAMGTSEVVEFRIDAADELIHKSITRPTENGLT